MKREQRSDPINSRLAQFFSRPSVQHVAAILFVLAVFALFLSQADYRRSLNLWPRFDAVEYTMSAANWLRYGRPALLVGNHFYPSRCLLGYPLLLTPQLLLTDYRLAYIFITTIMLSAATLVVFYFFAADLTRSRWTATLAAVLLATTPFYIRFSILVMSDVPVLLFFIAMHWLWLRILRRGAASAMLWLWLGLLAGYLSAWRITYAFPFFLFVAHFGIWGPGDFQARSKTLAYALCAFGIPAGLTMIYHLHYFGSPFATEYHRLWDPAYSRPELVFNWRNALYPLFDRRAGNLFYYLSLLGGGWPKAFYSTLFILAAIWGFIRGKLEGGSTPAGSEQKAERSFWRTWLCGALIMLGVFICYIGQQWRFINFMLPPLALLAARGLTAYGRERMPKADLRQATNACLVLGAGLIVVMHFLLVRGSRYAEGPAPKPLIEVARELRPLIPEGAVVFTNDSPSLIHWALDGRNMVLPFWQDDPVLEQVFGEHSAELSDHHIMMIDHFSVKPLAKWRDYPVENMEQLFRQPDVFRPVQLNRLLLDVLKQENIDCYLLVVRPGDYLALPQFFEFANGLEPLVGDFGDNLGLFRINRY